MSSKIEAALSNIFQHFGKHIFAAEDFNAHTLIENPDWSLQKGSYEILAGDSRLKIVSSEKPQIDDFDIHKK